jgi:hypothetical protein
MGVGYYVNLVQWSKGEYLSANNTEDDLAIITNNNNNVDYRVDDASATFATAPYLEILADNTVSNEGIIETRTDVDAFRFTTAGGGGVAHGEYGERRAECRPSRGDLQFRECAHRVEQSRCGA